MTPDIRKLNFYTSKNTFTGSYQGKNFKIVPGENMAVSIWDTPLCSELAQTEVAKDFPMTEEGFQELTRWLGQQLECAGNGEIAECLPIANGG